MFIARISRGRTIREFVLSVLFVPTGFTLVWMTVFGNTAMWLQLSGVTTAVSETVASSVPLALFAFLEQFPLAFFTSALATLLVVTFFVTSADSAALVVDTITSGGAEETPAWRRVFWALLTGAVAAVLLFAGGLESLQTATIASALPFTLIMLAMCYGLLKALRLEALRATLVLATPAVAGGAGGSWQRQLHTILHHPSRAEVLAFLADVAAPALEAVCREFDSRGVEATVLRDEDRIRLVAMPGTREEFRYGIRARGFNLPSFAYSERTPRADESRDRYYRAEVFLREGGQDYDVLGHAREELIADVLAQYERHRNFLHAAERTAD
jgi:choline/glycine/proline betaine transport protein